MVNKIILQKIKDEFMKQISLNKYSFSVDNISLINKNDYSGDLTDLISCSKDYYEDLIKIYSMDCDNVIELNQDTKLDLSVTGILYIIIKSNLNLELNFNSDYFSAICVKILVEENVNLNLIEKINSDNLYKNLFIFQKSNSNVNHSQFIYNCKLNISESNLFENAKYDLKSAYYIKNNTSYIKNIVKHIKENSNSNMLIQGGCENNSYVICDGKIIIEKCAKNSIGIQNLKNIILDDSSKIESEPILEIKNSEVSCSHGSSISKISNEVLFYLQSRGIDNSLSKQLIINSFFKIL